MNYPYKKKKNSTDLVNDSVNTSSEGSLVRKVSDKLRLHIDISLIATPSSIYSIKIYSLEATRKGKLSLKFK